MHFANLTNDQNRLIENILDKEIDKIWDKLNNAGIEFNS